MEQQTKKTLKKKQEKTHPHGGGDGVGDPVDHDVGEQPVEAETGGGQAAVAAPGRRLVRPSGELFQDVGGQSGRRVAQRHAHRVGFRCLRKETTKPPKTERERERDQRRAFSVRSFLSGQ